MFCVRPEHGRNLCWLAGITDPSTKKRNYVKMYFLDIVEDGSDNKCVLRGKLGNCQRLFNEQKMQKV